MTLCIFTIPEIEGTGFFLGITCNKWGTNLSSAETFSKDCEISRQFVLQTSGWFPWNNESLINAAVERNQTA